MLIEKEAQIATQNNVRSQSCRGVRPDPLLDKANEGFKCQLALGEGALVERCKDTAGLDHRRKFGEQVGSHDADVIQQVTFLERLLARKQKPRVILRIALSG